MYCLVGTSLIMPIGKDAVTDLIATPEQRKYMYYQVRDLRSKKNQYSYLISGMMENMLMVV